MTRALLIIVLALAGCQPAPRSVSYFETHSDEAARIVAACRTGAHRGRECESAQAGLAASQAKARQALFRQGFK